ncbi:MAG: hypothetical protein UIE84_01720 [Christensenellales bacterium]|nr:hypothetical protein [Christensenellales bacterium]
MKTLLPKSSSMLAIRDSSSKVISLLKAFQRRGKAALLSVALLVKRAFFAFTKKRATARTNEIHLTAPLLLTTSIAAWKGFVKGFFALILFFPFKNDKKNENAERSQKAANAPNAEKMGAGVNLAVRSPKPMKRKSAG